MKTRLVLTLAAALGLATLGTSHARAQALLTFSGGTINRDQLNPLTLTLAAPVTYAITRAGDGPIFVIQNLGNEFLGLSVSGTITFTVNGGAAQAIYTLRSNVNSHDVMQNDGNLFGTLPGVAVGDLVTLSAGELTTSDDFRFNLPANGSYQTFIVDGPGNRLDALNGTAVVPEPSTWALLGVGTGTLALAARRRRMVRAA